MLRGSCREEKDVDTRGKQRDHHNEKPLGQLEKGKPKVRTPKELGERAIPRLDSRIVALDQRRPLGVQHTTQLPERAECPKHTPVWHQSRQEGETPRALPTKSRQRACQPRCQRPGSICHRPAWCSPKRGARIGKEGCTPEAQRGWLPRPQLGQEHGSAPTQPVAENHARTTHRASCRA